MSPTQDSNNGRRAAAPPALPANVCIFAPTDASNAQALLHGRIFTRLVVSAATEPAHLAAALRNRPDVGDAFCLSHRNVVLLFGGGELEGAALEDAHHEHFRLVCLALKDRDIGLDVAGCVFDTPDVLQAGFQLDELSGGAVLVIDLMGGDDDDSDSDSDDDHSAAQGFLMGGDANTTMS